MQYTVTRTTTEGAMATDIVEATGFEISDGHLVLGPTTPAGGAAYAPGCWRSVVPAADTSAG